MTDRALRFEPNWLDYALMARGWRYRLDEVGGAEVERAKLSLSPHKARTRVKIQAGGSVVLVAVADPLGFIGVLESATGRS